MNTLGMGIKMDDGRNTPSDTAQAAHTLATIVATKLDSHLAECTRRQEALTTSINSVQADVKGIMKWVWIATGVMLAVSKAVDFLGGHHAGG